MENLKLIVKLHIMTDNNSNLDDPLIEVEAVDRLDIAVKGN